MNNTGVKVSYVGTHGTRMAQYYSYNDAANAYVWYASTGLPMPTGEFANVARRNFDQELFGTIWQYQKSGWSNDSSIVAEIQHRYSKGYAFQVFYVMSNALRSGGNGWADDVLPTSNLYLPGAVPEDQNARNRLLFYRRDTDIPKHRVNWNWVYDLPLGKGKPFGRNSRGIAQPPDRRLADRRQRNSGEPLFRPADLQLGTQQQRGSLWQEVPDPGLPQRCLL